MPAYEFHAFLKRLLLEVLLINVPAEYREGKKMYDELELLSRFDREQWGTKAFLPCDDARRLSKYKEYRKRLEREANDQVVRLGFKNWDIKGPFFKILEVLGDPPTSIIVQENLIQTLANFFFEIIRLSNEILLNGPEHPSFWINFETYSRCYDGSFNGTNGSTNILRSLGPKT